MQAIHLARIRALYAWKSLSSSVTTLLGATYDLNGRSSQKLAGGGTMPLLVGILIGWILSSIFSGTGLLGGGLKACVAERDRLKLEMRQMEMDVQDTFSGIQTKLKATISDLELKMEDIESQRDEANHQRAELEKQRDLCRGELQICDDEREKLSKAYKKLSKEVKMSDKFNAVRTEEDIEAIMLQYKEKYKEEAQSEIDTVSLQAANNIEAYRRRAASAENIAEKLEQQLDECKEQTGVPRDCQAQLVQREKKLKAECDKKCKEKLANGELGSSSCRDQVAAAKELALRQADEKIEAVKVEVKRHIEAERKEMKEVAQKEVAAAKREARAAVAEAESLRRLVQQASLAKSGLARR